MQDLGRTLIFLGGFLLLAVLWSWCLQGCIFPWADFPATLNGEDAGGRSSFPLATSIVVSVAAQPALLDCRPRAPVAAGTHAAMLDSGGMPRSEDHPPTLASLRARRGNIRAAKAICLLRAEADEFEAQTDLFASLTMVEPNR